MSKFENINQSYQMDRLKSINLNITELQSNIDDCNNELEVLNNLIKKGYLDNIEERDSLEMEKSEREKELYNLLSEKTFIQINTTEGKN